MLLLANYTAHTVFIYLSIATVFSNAISTIYFPADLCQAIKIKFVDEQDPESVAFAAKSAVATTGHSP